MYFHAAQTSYRAAKSALKGIGQARKDFADLRKEEAAILGKHDSHYWSAYDELESTYIQMDNSQHGIGAAYGPYLQNIAITHILCTMVTEAHINVIAKEELEGRYWENFDRLRLEGKWLLLPRILGMEGFDQGAEPFQSFSKMTKYRNDLVHYKGKREEWEFLDTVKPNFLNRLGLSLPEARSSLGTVKKLISTLSKLIDRDPPYWLREGYDELPQGIVTNFFDVGVERTKS